MKSYEIYTEVPCIRRVRVQIEPSQIKLLTKCKLCESDGKNVNRVEDLDTSKPHNL